MTTLEYSENEFRIIKGSSGKYEVNCVGIVRRVETGRALKPFEVNKSGLKHIMLCLCGKSRTISVARAVALAFIGDPPRPSLIVGFKDGDNQNTHYGNLFWRYRGRGGGSYPFIKLNNGVTRTKEDVYRVIKGTGGKYEVNCFGVIRNVQTGYVMNQKKGTRSNLVVSLGGTTRGVAMVVAETFLPPMPFKAAVVGYKDGNPHNIHADNLQWVYKKGQREIPSKIVKQIIDEYTGERGDITRLSIKWGISKCTLSLILNGKTYRDIRYFDGIDHA